MSQTPTLRRGLPRVPGGEPWPPAGIDVPGAPEVADLVPATDADVPAARPDAPAPAPAGASAPGSTPAGFGADDVLRGGGSAPQGTESAPSGETPRTTPVLRRGLPRVAGGDPWPPAGIAGPGAAGERPDADLSRARADADAAAVTDAPASASAPAPAQAPTPTGFGADDVLRGGGSAPQGTESAPSGETPAARMLRRGLPRVPGGEPWPPVTPVVARGARASEAASRPAAAFSASAAEPAPAAAEPPAAPPAAAAVPPAHAAAPVPGIAAPAPAAAVAAPAGPRPPLPFTPTVWPGAAASGPRGPQPEPRRYGPFTRAQWAGAVVVAGAGLLIAGGMAVAIVRWFLSTEWGAGFLASYPGEYHLPEGAPVGFPAWLGWQHFFNAFLIVLIIRSGLQVRREKRPTVFWSPRGSTKRKISLALWFHQSLDILWLANGVIFVVLLFVTGQWMRIVPTSWEVLPNAVSAALQYVSLDWPTENGWVNYNSLQQLAYFATVFLAAPLAAITGVRMSGIWPKDNATLNRIYPVEWARRIHFPVMIYFVLFILAHVALVFATGALRNLNHMYAAQDAVNWTGFWIFVASIAAIGAAWVAARPLILAPIARLFGEVKGR